jgi:hypothetical protein
MKTVNRMSEVKEALSRMKVEVNRMELLIGLIDLPEPGAKPTSVPEPTPVIRKIRARRGNFGVSHYVRGHLTDSKGNAIRNDTIEIPGDDKFSLKSIQSAACNVLGDLGMKGLYHTTGSTDSVIVELK